MGLRIKLNNGEDGVSVWSDVSCSLTPRAVAAMAQGSKLLALSIANKDVELRAHFRYTGP